MRGNQLPFSAARWLRGSQICYANFTKYLKIANNSTNTKAREKISTYLESLEFRKYFDICLTKFRNNQIFRTKISHRILLTT
jgi:hypothetical protein